MKVVSTLHQPSAVLSSLSCKLSADAESGHLIVGRANRLEVSSIHPQGLKSECTLDIWGRVLALRAVPSETAGVSNVLVLTDHPDPKLILLEYNTDKDTPELTETWSSSLYDRHARHAEYLNDIIVHPAGRAVVVSCYAGKLKVVTFKNGKVDSDFDVILPELNLLSLSFLYAEPDAHTHTVALLHIDHKQRIQLLARQLDVDAMDLSIEVCHTIPHSVLPANHFPFTETPLQLVPVPRFALAQSPSDESEEDRPARCRGGVIVLGGRKVNFYELADKRTVRELKNKDKRQEKRRASGSGNPEALREAEQKDAAREVKKVKPRATVKWPWSEVAAWCPADDDMRRFFVADIFGRLSMLVLNDAPEFIIIPLGETSPPTSLSYLTSQVLFVGSHAGDSQLLRISPTPRSDLDSDTLPIPGGISTISPAALGAPRAESPDDDYDMREAADNSQGRGGKVVKCKGNYIEVLSRFPNIAPIMDAVLADPEESGQPQIVTCSGGSNSGSLNVVRTGADFQEFAVLQEIPNVTNLWPIRSRYTEKTDAFVLATTLYEAYFFRIDGRDSVSRIEPSATSLISDQPTLAISNIPRRVVEGGRSSYQDSSLVVQVTPQGINLVEYDAALDTFSKVGNGWFLKEQANAEWRSRDIVAASVNPSQFAIALSGGTVLLFNLSLEGQINLAQQRNLNISGSKEIAAISCAPLDPTKNFSPFVAVSFWESNTIQLLNVKDPETPLLPHSTSASLPALPHSLLLHNFGTGRNLQDADFQPYVVAGLADGTVACLSFRNNSNELKDQKLFSLGTAPVSLTVTEIDGKRAVFATGSRAAVFYWDKQRLRQSPVMVKNVTVGSSLNTTAYPSCQILATPSSLVIGQTRGVDKMQIRTIPLGYGNPRRIAYHPALNLFGVSILKSTPPRVGEAEISESIFRIMDGITFNAVADFVADQDEEISAVHALTSQGAIGSFIVGTVKHQVGEFEPSSGRIVLFEVTPARELKRLTEAEVRGCVYAIANVGNVIAIAVNTSVDLYAAVHQESEYELKKIASWNHNYFVTSLVAKDNRLIAGDAISSVSVLDVQGHNLKTVARDYGPIWPVAVEGTHDGGVISANTDGNLYTFALPEGADKKLERKGSYHLGELVNRFVAGGLGGAQTQEGQRPLFVPEQIFFTSSGRIGLIHDVSDEVALELTALQRNMAGAIVGPGKTQHGKWRTPANSRGRSDAEDTATGFLDGDFLEQFLTYPEPEKLLQGRIAAERLSTTVEYVESVLEKLQSLH